MADGFGISEIRGALARGYCATGNRHKVLDERLLNAQADEIVALIEANLVEEPTAMVAVAGEALIGNRREVLDEDEGRRSRAYDIAIQMGYHNRPKVVFDQALAEIDRNLAIGIPNWPKVPEPIRTLTVKLDVEPITLEAVKAAEDRLERAWTNIRHAWARIHAARNEIMSMRALNNPVGQRREGWNDLKAVMIRVINRQLAGDDDSFTLHRKSTLEKVRDFVASFQFDETKP